MSLEIQQSHISDIQTSGYCKIHNFFDSKIVQDLNAAWQDIVNLALKSHLVKLEQGAGRKKDIDQILPKAHTYKKNGRYDLWKAHYILIHTDIGKKLIGEITPLMHKINPKLVFMKDRIMNQGAKTKGHKPHQDTASGRQGFFEKYTTGEIYTVYVSMTDTHEDNGCLWLEQAEERRKERLGYCDTGCVAGNDCHCTNWEYTSIDIENYKGHKMIPMKQNIGDAVIFDGYALHGTGKNITEDTRKTLLFMFAVPKQEYADKELFWKYTYLHYGT